MDLYYILFPESISDIDKRTGRFLFIPIPGWETDVEALRLCIRSLQKLL